MIASIKRSVRKFPTARGRPKKSKALHADVIDSAIKPQRQKITLELTIRNRRPKGKSPMVATTELKSMDNRKAASVVAVYS